MKNVKLLIISFFIFVGLCFAFSNCEKEENPTLTQEEQLEDQNFKATSPKPNPQIIVSVDGTVIFEGRFNRAIDVRPRDGEECCCRACFGICDVNKACGSAYSDGNEGLALLDYRVPDMPRLYFLETLDNFEAEFGVDFPVEIPSTFIQDKNIQTITFTPGLYNFYEGVEYVYFDKDSILTYGFVDLDINIDYKK